ncbi:MAG: hypothetical protein LBI45_08610 [Bacteroidales bacterium]|jgi:hypothetical protein|nr:hypothetical protein [Bacteroidales bacterium]
MSIAYTHRRFNQTKDYGDLLFYAPLTNNSITPLVVPDNNYNILDANNLVWMNDYTEFYDDSYLIWESSIPTNLPAYTLNCWIDQSEIQGYTFGLYNSQGDINPNYYSLQNYWHNLTRTSNVMILRNTIYFPSPTVNDLINSDTINFNTFNNCLVSIVLLDSQNSTLCYFYINGVYYGNNMMVGLFPTPIYSHPCIGDVVFRNNETLEGNYSHFSIYVKAMSQQEIINLYYNGGVPPEI